jgi:hypothetical protein
MINDFAARGQVVLLIALERSEAVAAALSYPPETAVIDYAAAAAAGEAAGSDEGGSVILLCHFLTLWGFSI